MEKWESDKHEALMKLFPAIREQLNSMSRLQWKIDHETLVAQGFPRSQDLYIAIRSTSLAWNRWTVFLRYRNHECGTDMLIKIKNMEDLIAVFRGWLAIFEKEMPPVTQLQMDLSDLS